MNNLLVLFPWFIIALGCWGDEVNDFLNILPKFHIKDNRMETYYEYTFEVTHDAGSFFMRVISYSKASAIKMICKAEGCPERAIEYINKSLRVI